MATITYREIRPGKWVKEIDGEAVGPATAAEVAAWKEKRATPTRIWEDIVATASRPPSGETKVTKPSSPKAEAPAEPRARRESDQSTVWEDLVKRAKPSVQAESPPERRPPKEDVDWAKQVKMWQDAVKRAQKPGPQPERQPAQSAPPLPKAASEEKPKPASKTSPIPTATPGKASHPTAAAEPEGEGSSAKKAFAAEVAAPKLATQALKPTAEVKAKEKAAPLPKAPEAKPAPQAAPPAKPTMKATTKPARERAPAQKASPEEAPPVPKAPATKATRQKPTVKAAPAKKTKATHKRTKPATPKELPAKLLDEIAAEENAPVAEPVEEAAPSEARSSRAKAGPATVSHRTAGKAKASAAQERPNQLYLWMAAGQTDDLIATVRTGLTRYQERFSQPAEVVLCHSTDLTTLEGAKLPVDLREGKSLAPRNFWIGLK